jgi:hypothetical protein
VLKCNENYCVDSIFNGSNEKLNPPRRGFDVPLATALCKTFLLRMLNDS